ncbi:MAG: chorismate mutase [Phycisphaeraceae bacterium]|nr:chorismate mutase [Phycisphaeraceae bacterium]
MSKDASESRLEALRGRIDELDGQLIDLLNRRAEVVVEIGDLKRDQDFPIYAPDREKQVLDAIRARNGGPLPDTCIEAIWRELMSGSFALERPLRVAYLGPPGTFSHMAARRKFGACVAYEDLESIRAVFQVVVSKEADMGLVPIENSSQGGIGETLDAFVEMSVHVCAEVLIGVHHNLLARAPIDRIRRIYSKPEALSQCRAWLAANVPNAELVAAASTSRAAEMAAGETDTAAVGSELAAEIHGLEVRGRCIEDDSNNVTRFFVIAREGARPTGDDKTAIMFTTAHEVGALSRVLDVFRDGALNLTHIDKRPSRVANWEYYFFVEFEGHETDDSVVRAIEQARSHCLNLTVLGSFAKAREVI